MADFYHVCFAVPDIERAMEELTAATGARWAQPRSETMGEWGFRIVFSQGDAPFVELIEGSPGSPWDCRGRARFDHLGYWAADLHREAGRLEAAGAPQDFSGCPYGRPFAYHRLDSLGARIEIVDAARRPGFAASWGLDCAGTGVLGG